MNKLKKGPWRLSDLALVKPVNKTVFSCFHCGGGSTMGYKLAGYTVLGGVEIDPKMMNIYRRNHRPKLSYLMGVRDFLKEEDLPAELYNLDILDGSPPCSSFSTAGARERLWGEKKKFREGQEEQVLDDLFFTYIDIAARLRPKVVIAENVKGLIIGAAKGYVKQIFSCFKDIGYDVQLFLLNSATMGVPQKRERTIFIARRRDLNFSAIKLDFKERPIVTSEIISGIETVGAPINAPYMRKQWDICPPGGGADKAKGGYNTRKKVALNHVPYTQTAAHAHFHWSKRAYISDALIKRIQTFPDDFDFVDQKAHYVCGMSVPPFMMQRIANEVYKQWLNP